MDNGGHQNYLKIVSWNANGIRKKKPETTHFLADHQPDVLLIQETHLKPSDRFTLPNYQIIRQDRLHNRGGGTLIAIHKTISHYEVPNPAENLEGSFAAITTNMQRTITIGSVYVSPNSTLTGQQLQQLFADPDQTVIIGGDLNAKHLDWRCLSTNARGQLIQEMAAQLQFTAWTPDEPTHIGMGRPEILDLFLIKNVQQITEPTVLHEMSSDHLPIQVDFGNPLRRPNRAITIQTTEWNTFQALLQQAAQQPQIHNTEDLDLAAANLTATIQTALDGSKRQTIVTTTKQQLPDDIKEEIRTRNRIRRLALRTRDPYLLNMMYRANRQIRQKINSLYNDQFQNKLEAIEGLGDSVYKLARSLIGGPKKKMPFLKVNNATISDPVQKVEALADSLEQQFTNNPPLYQGQDDQAAREVELALRFAPLVPAPPNIATVDNIQKAIATTQRRRAPGSDKITNQALKKLPLQQVTQLTNIVKATFQLAHFPTPWKEANIILIRKPGEPSNNPKSYRPISLLSALGKICERLILWDLKDTLEDRRILPDEQMGFRSNHSTTHQAVRLTSNIVQGANRGMETGAVFLDIAKAFDKMWHLGLAVKLTRHNLPTNQIRLIQSFLQGRSFKVSVDGQTSTVRPILAGVPQGSPLSPLLFNLYMADIPRSEETELYAYADDTAITATARQRAWIKARLQRHLNMLSTWMDRWRLEVNPNKTQAITFGKNRKRQPNQRQQLQWKGNPLQWSNQAKYLGITYDAKLSWKKHIQKVRGKAIGQARLLYPLLNRSSKLNLQTKMLIYKIYIRPILTYAAPAWATTATTRTLLPITELENRWLRSYTAAPWFIRNTTLRRDTGLQTLKDFINHLASRHFEHSETNENPLIRRSHVITPPGATYQLPHNHNEE